MHEGTGTAVSCNVGHKHGSDLVFLWLWRRPLAIALIPRGPEIWKEEKDGRKEGRKEGRNACHNYSEWPQSYSPNCQLYFFCLIFIIASISNMLNAVISLAANK